MKKQYINASNEAPKFNLGTITFWFLVIRYFDLPTWVLGIWGTLSAILIFSFFYRVSNEEGIDITKRN